MYCPRLTRSGRGAHAPVHDQGLLAAAGVADRPRVPGRCGRDANEVFAVAWGGIRLRSCSQVVPFQCRISVVQPPRAREPMPVEPTAKASPAETTASYKGPGPPKGAAAAGRISSSHPVGEPQPSRLRVTY
jgi:hypothetical protein